LFLLALGFVYRLRQGSSTVDLIVGGRSLTLPAFVASLVSTWYGGILGVGEYSFSYGLSNWLVFGLPYYLAAFLFAIFLAKKARRSELLTIPQRLKQAYGDKTALTGSLILFLMTVPAAYVLMLGSLGQLFFGWPLWIGIVGGTIFSTIYLFLGGFRAVVRTDLLQFGLMFVGFAVLVALLYSTYGGFEFLQSNLPSDHLTWHGGRPAVYIATWYVIALATLIEPAFYQRCYAAKSESVVRKGIFISIGCWALFDFLTTSSGLYARALLPDLSDPIASFPALAVKVLPVGLLGLFLLALLSTIMSTVDSYSFLAATTFANDIMKPLKQLDENGVKRYTQIGLLLTTLIAVALALFFQSVVDIWYLFGTIGTPALLVPLFTAFVGRRRLRGASALFSIIVSGLLSLVWALSAYWTSSGDYWFSLEPIYPGLLMSLVIFVVRSKPVGTFSVQQT
jgi:SSS family solute:Na+ symporter